jgi:long-subunit fatty acid transport protein
MKGIFAALLIAAALPTAAYSADLSYKYLDLAYSSAATTAEGDTLQDGTGYRADGNYGLGDSFFLEGAYQTDQFRYSMASFRASHSAFIAQYRRVGVGYHLPLTEQLDLVTHLDFGRVRTTENDIGYTTVHGNNGYVVGVGLRWEAVAGLELDAGLDHDDMAFGNALSTCCSGGAVRQSGSENVLSAAVRYRFISWLGVGLEYQSSSYDGWREWLISLRANF